MIPSISRKIKKNPLCLKTKYIYLRFIFEVDCVSIAFLQNSRMKIVFMLNVEIPSTHVSWGQIVTAHFCRLNVPYEAIEAVATVSVLVTNSDSGCGHSINPLENREHYF